MVFDIPIFDLSAVSTTSLGVDSTMCEYFSCDHAADYVTSGTGDGTGDGVIYPEYTPFNANAEHTSILVADTDHSGAYYCAEPEADCSGSIVDPTLKPIEMPVFAAGDVAQTSILGVDSTMCEYFSCDHAADYVTSGTGDGTGDGVIYPKYTPFNANAEHTQALLGEEHSADYIGTSGELTGDGVIYPEYTPFNANAEHTAILLGEEHSADYIGTSGELTGDGVIYPEYTPFNANAEHTSILVADTDHSGAYYCTEPEADCSVEVVDPVLTPIEMPVVVAGSVAQTSILGVDSTMCEYYSCDHAADYIGSDGGYLTDGTMYPSQALAPVAPMATPAAQAKGSAAKPVKPTPGHFMLMGHACVFGAIDATSKLMESGDFEKFVANFKTSSVAGAKAVTPVGGYVLENAMKA